MASKYVEEKGERSWSREMYRNKQKNGEGRTSREGGRNRYMATENQQVRGRKGQAQ